MNLQKYTHPALLTALLIGTVLTANTPVYAQFDAAAGPLPPTQAQSVPVVASPIMWLNPNTPEMLEPFLDEVRSWCTGACEEGRFEIEEFYPRTYVYAIVYRGEGDSSFTIPQTARASNLPVRHGFEDATRRRFGQGQAILEQVRYGYFWPTYIPGEPFGHAMGAFDGPSTIGANLWFSCQSVCEAANFPDYSQSLTAERATYSNDECNGVLTLPSVASLERPQGLEIWALSYDIQTQTDHITNLHLIGEVRLFEQVCSVQVRLLGRR